MRSMVASQSALFTICAALVARSKSRNRDNCSRMPRRFSATCSRVCNCRSAVLPLGSPMRPVPPPTIAIGRVPGTLHPREGHDRQQRPDVQARGGGVEPDVAGHRLLGQHLGQALGGLVHHPTPVELVEHAGHAHVSSLLRLRLGLRHRSPRPRQERIADAVASTCAAARAVQVVGSGHASPARPVPPAAARGGHGRRGRHRHGAERRLGDPRTIGALAHAGGDRAARLADAAERAHHRLPDGPSPEHDGVARADRSRGGAGAGPAPRPRRARGRLRVVRRANVRGLGGGVAVAAAGAARGVRRARQPRRRQRTCPARW